MKTITFLTGLFFPTKRHSNNMDLLIDTIADIGATKIYIGWEILIPNILRS